MFRGALAAAAVAVLIWGCGGGPSPSPSIEATASFGSTGTAAVTPEPVESAAASETPAPSGTPGPSPTGPRELSSGSAVLAPGTYTSAAVQPQITFGVGEGWLPGSVLNGFFDVQRDKGTPDVVAVQFADVEGVVGAKGDLVTAPTADVAAAAIRQNPDIVVIDGKVAKIGGMTGVNVVIENRGDAHAGILSVAPGLLGIDPGRRLSISLVDTPNGVLSIMVGGSVAKWQRALDLSQPVLESIGIGP
jgi:hypothetical protein